MGRTLAEEDDKLSLFAVGDDDQNVYAFNGSSTEFIRRFEEDYSWTLRILSGISEGICNTMVQSGGEFLYIGVGGR